MLIGAIIENNQIGTMPTESSFAKLRAMQATAVGLLWTQGTKHRRAVYERCEWQLAKPHYIVRVGGHRQTPAEWLADARDAIVQIPTEAILEGRVLLVCGNEPNLEGWGDSPEDYGRLYRSVGGNPAQQIAFACPSLGMEGWAEWLARALAVAGPKPSHGIVNLYAGNVYRIGDFIGMFGELYVGEVNSPPHVRGRARVDALGVAFGAFERVGVKAALVFIAGGKSDGAWDDRYILSDDEAREIGELGSYEEEIMDTETRAKLDMLLAQNALLTQAWVAFREGRFEGADGIDGIIVALNGGQLPEGYAPVYPPK